MAKKVLGKKQNVNKESLRAFSCGCSFCVAAGCKCGARMGTAQHTAAMLQVNNVKNSMSMTAIQML